MEASERNLQLRRASLANQQGRWQQSEAIARGYLEASGRDPLALVILGEALLGMRRAVDAEQVIREAIAASAGVPRARLALSRSLEMQCRIDEAVELLDDLLGEQPGSRDLWEYLAQLLGRAHRFGRAIEAHEHVLRFESENPRLWLEYAIALRFAGRQPDALQALRHSIELDPSYGPAWWIMANMAPDAITAADRGLIERGLAQSGHDQISRFLHVALATVLDRSREYERAWRHFAAGKALGAASARYDPRRLESDNAAAIERFDQPFFDHRDGFGAESSAPIFIVGLPRSGSTLVERILGGHSKIEAAGELPIIPSLIAQLKAEVQRGCGLRELLPKLSAGRARELGELYLARSQEFRTTDKPLFIDKLHMNWLNLAFIRLILPKARIIDVRRNALDCCWSNFKTIFTSGHPASDDLGHIGRFYREYVRMMDHAAGWSEGAVLNMRYEALVADIERETRRMIAFLGLEFEPACLEFHQLETPAATLSAEQVRRPLNSDGIGRWKPYRQWLGPLFDALGPLAAEER
jgi:tetratricopeptide (TPR) repeat protein